MDHTSWNQFVLEHGSRSGRFLQSWEWGEFQASHGEVVRLQTFEYGGTTVGIAQWLERQAMDFIHYAYCPKGPIFKKGFGGSERLTGLKD